MSHTPQESAPAGAPSPPAPPRDLMDLLREQIQIAQVQQQQVLHQQVMLHHQQLHQQHVQQGFPLGGGTAAAAVAPIGRLPSQHQQQQQHHVVQIVLDGNVVVPQGANAALLQQVLHQSLMQHQPATRGIPMQIIQSFPTRSELFSSEEGQWMGEGLATCSVCLETMAMSQEEEEAAKALQQQEAVSSSSQSLSPPAVPTTAGNSDPVSSSSESTFPPIPLLRLLPCGHWFHEMCIMPWLQRSNLCPTCRANAEEF